MRCRPSAIVGLLGVLLAGWLLAGATSHAAPQQQGHTPVAGEVAQLSSDLRVRVRRGRDIELEVRAARGDSWEVLAARVTGAATDAQALAIYNGAGRLSGGDWVRVPLSMLSMEYRSLVLSGLFPDDRRDGRDWIHVVRSGVLPTYDEGLWQVAEWFTGDGANYRELMELNRLGTPELRQGQALRIPGELLHVALVSRATSDDRELEFDSDSDGPYAVYRLKPGEALYSSVIVRFTGRTANEDVRQIASVLQARSGIRDLHDIPVGYQIKIPLALLEPRHLPASHPKRLEAEAAQHELELELAQRPMAGTPAGLRDVIVILDAGHGGRDLGTMNNGIWEHDYVYDVTCRLKERLEQTAAKVVLTIIDQQTGCVPTNSDKLAANQQGTVQTHPPFMARQKGEAKIGVNLRWYLANSVYRSMTKDGTDPDKVIFISLHADSRHPSLRGVMVYVPGAAYRTKTYGHTSKTYTRYREVREQPHVSFSKKDRIRSEAISRELADRIVTSFRRQGLPVQQHEPVRGRIIRGDSSYLPAVLRSNVVPTKVLVEMINLSNPDDAAVLASARERDRLSEALYRALLDHFGEDAGDVDPRYVTSQ